MEGVSVDPRPLSVSDVSLQGASLTQPGPTSQSRDLHTSPWPCPWGSCARTSLRTQRHRTACTSPAQRQSQHTSCLQHPKYHLLLLISPRKRGACRRHKPSLAQVQSTDAPTRSWPAFIPCATSIPLTEPSVLVSQRRGFSYRTSISMHLLKVTKKAHPPPTFFIPHSHMLSEKHGMQGSFH